MADGSTGEVLRPSEEVVTDIIAVVGGADVVVVSVISLKATSIGVITIVASMK